MKNVIVVCFLLYAGVSSAQRVNYYPDSIRVELPEHHAILVMEMRNYPKNPASLKNIPTLLKETWDAAVQGLTATAPDAPPQRIEARVIPDGEKEIIAWSDDKSFRPVGWKTIIRIVPAQEQATDLTAVGNKVVELLPTGWEIKISTKDVRIWVYADTYAHLESAIHQNLNPVMEKISSEPNFQRLGKSSIQAFLQLKNDQISQSLMKRKYPGDNLFITGTAGVGLFRDKLYPQLTLSLGITFRDHFGRKNIRTSFLWDNLFFAEKGTDGYLNNVNSFLSLSFEKNFNTKTKSPQWFGIGAGLLTRRNGDYFKGNTAKIFIIHEMENRRISLQPEFYLTDDFKKFAFGMTMKYTF